MSETTGLKWGVESVRHKLGSPDKDPRQVDNTAVSIETARSRMKMVDGNFSKITGCNIQRGSKVRVINTGRVWEVIHITERSGMLRLWGEKGISGPCSPRNVELIKE